MSAEDAQRLARQFLIGKGGEAELARLQAGLQADETLALELLSQMQGALDDVAPAGLTRDQWQVVDSRVHALIQPRMKAGLPLFGWFFKLFKRKPKEEPAGASRVKRRGGGAPSAPEEAPAAAPAAFAPETKTAVDSGALDETLPGGDGMEEMAPIAAPSAPAPAPVAEPKPAKAEAKPAKPKAPPRPGRAKALALRFGAAALVLALGGGGWVLRSQIRSWGEGLMALLTARFQKQGVAVLPPPSTAAPSPTPVGPPRRGVPPAAGGEEPLPAALREATPVPAGSWEAPQGGGVYAQPTIEAPIRR